jgi:hypothetical protein
MRDTRADRRLTWYIQTCMKPNTRNDGSGPGSLKPELDAAFAAVQLAAGEGRRGNEQERALALDQVRKVSAMVKIALEEPDRSEADKHLLRAKLRALMEAAGRIPTA